VGDFRSFSIIFHHSFGSFLAGNFHGSSSFAGKTRRLQRRPREVAEAQELSETLLILRWEYLPVNQQFAMENHHLE
jgi:hypothetical protein